jgi:hypothetical protein
MTMNWLEPPGTPLAKTREEAEAYITAELERAIPSGWTVASGWNVGRVPEPPLEWRIKRQESSQDYGVLLPESLDYVIFTHGNNDIGGFDLHQACQNALVIDAWALRYFGMPACLQYLMSHYQPNEWGYS